MSIDVVVDAGKRAYVRRVSFAGNRVTQDEVMRRELRQMEGGWASTAQIDLSKLRLERLGYFQEVNVETPEVPGTDDQIDVNFDGGGTTLGQHFGDPGLQPGMGPGGRRQLPGKQRARHGQQPRASACRTRNTRNRRTSTTSTPTTPSTASAGATTPISGAWTGTSAISPATAPMPSASGVNFGFPIGETQRINFGGSVEQTNP